MKKSLWLILFLNVLSISINAQSNSFSDLKRLYDYDSKKPLDIQETKVIERKEARIREISFDSPKEGSVTAFLVEPVRKGRYAGIIFGHWGYGTKTEFLAEAIEYAKSGAVSILIDYPWVRPAPWRRNVSGDQAEAVRDLRIAAVVDLRRAIDLLLTRKDVDPERIGYVGHSFGAQWGAILSAVDDRVKAAVLIGGVPSEAAIILESNDPQYVEFRKNTPKEKLDSYLKITGIIDGIKYVPYAAPTPLLFQFARFERYFDEPAMLKYFEAASEPKTIKWYDTGHEVNDWQALIDRAEWLNKFLKLKISIALKK